MADMTFAEHVNIVANLDNSLSMSATMSRSGVALKVGSTYDVVSVLSVHNRTTNQTEHTTISGTITSATIGAYLSLLKSTIEAAYPIAVTTSTTSTVSQVATMNTVGVELTLSGSAYYIRALNMKISLAGVEQYDIDAELVNPLELTPKMLNLTDEVLLAIDSIDNNMTSISSVAENASNINAIAGSLANLNTVASIQNLANMTTVANDLNAMDLNGIADVTVVANNLVLGAGSSINRVSASIDNVNTVMSNITNIDTVAVIDNSVTEVALIDDSVVTVAGKIAAIETANANATNINTVSGSIDNVNSVATTIVPNIAEILEADTNATTATTKAAEALASANAADASELLAGKWATEAVDTVVLNGKYSSYHWATKASESVATALTHAARTDNPHAVTAAQVGLGNVSNTAQVTAVTGTAPIVSSGGTTPYISISAATTSAPGSMSAADKTKLDGIATNANNYVLPTSVVHDNESGALHATDALRVSGTTLSLYKGDGTFEAVTTQDTVYVHPTTDGSLHVPATSTTNAGKVLTAGATAGSLSWVTPAVTDLTVTAGTTAGPTINSSTGADVVIPSASATASGVVTTGAQTFAGVKTMTSPVLVTPSIGVATGTSFNSITGLASVAPVAPEVTAAVGTSTLAARQDHVHPTNFTATATDIKMNGTQAVGTLTTFSRADHIHPTDTSRAAAATSVQKDSNTGVVYLTSGTTAQRPVLANNTVGIRYNTETSSSEVGVGTAGATTWSPVGGGGAIGSVLNKPFSGAPLFSKASVSTLTIPVGTSVIVNGKWISVATTAYTLSLNSVGVGALDTGTKTAGTDYYVYALEAGGFIISASPTNPTGYTTANSRKIGGFHYGVVPEAFTAINNITASDATKIAGINAYSFWDLKFKPVCDPSGMVYIQGRWYDIYLLNTDHHTYGTSAAGKTIAGGAVTNGRNFPKIPLFYGGDGTTTYGTLTWFEAAEIGKAYSKDMISYNEFVAIAYGVLEATSAGAADTGITQHLANFTSKFGLCMATGCEYIWGKNLIGAAGAAWNTNTEGRGSIYNASLIAAIFGGHRDDTVESGSRCSTWVNTVWNTNWHLGCRYACDHLELA